MEFPVRKLLKHGESFEPLVWWENLFGRSFSSIQPFLAPSEDRCAEFYPSPDDPSVRLVVRETQTRYHATPPKEVEDRVEDLILDWEDVQVHHLDCNRLRHALRKVFNLKPAARQSLGGLFYIGRCECNREVRHVYACLAVSASSALRAVSECPDLSKVGCVLFPAHHEQVTSLLQSQGIASVILREHLTLTPSGFSGECPANCSACFLPDAGQLISRLDTIEKTVLPDAARGSKTKKSASAGGNARAETYLEKYKEARGFIMKYHRKNPAVSFTQALKRASQHVDLGLSTLKKHIKKGDFPDW